MFLDCLALGDFLEFVGFELLGALSCYQRAIFLEFFRLDKVSSSSRGQGMVSGALGGFRSLLADTHLTPCPDRGAGSHFRGITEWLWAFQRFFSMGDAVWEQSICFLSASEVQDLLKNRFVRSLDSAQQGEIQRLWGAFIVQPRRWKLINSEPWACTAFIYQRAALIPNQRPFVLGPCDGFMTANDAQKTSALSLLPDFR